MRRAIPPTCRTAFVAGCLATLAGSVLWVAPVGGEELPWVHHDTGHPRVPLPSSSVQRVLQDRDGYIWLGFYVAGLLRYDGSTAEGYDLEDGLVHGTVREFVQDGAGHLWVGCETGVVVSDRPLSGYAPGEHVRFIDRLDDVELLHQRVRLGWMAEHPDGGVVVGTPDGTVIHYEHLGDRLVVTDLGRPDGGSSPVSAVTASDGGTVWLALEDGTLAWRPSDDASWSTVDEDRRPLHPVTALRFDDRGVLYSGSRDGSLWRKAPDAPDFVMIDNTLSEQVVDLLPTISGELWAASLGSGVVLVTPDAGGSLHITRAHGLPSDTVWDVLEDREGTLWFGHNGGLSKLQSDWRAFSAHTARRVGNDTPALPDPNAFAVLPVAGGGPARGLWVGTSDGIALLRGGRRVAHVTVDDGLPSASVYALALESDRRVWIGTLEGLACLTFVGPTTPNASTAPRRLRVGGAPATLTRHGLLTVYQVVAMADASGSTSVWVAGTHGLSALTDGGWIHLDASHGLPPTGTACVAGDDDGHVWAGTKDHGLVRSRDPLLRDPSTAHRTTPVFEPGPSVGDQPPARAIQAIAPVDGSMWAATGAGLYRIDRDTGGARWVARPVGRVPRIVTAATWDPSRSWLWTTSAEGLQAIDVTTNGILRTVSSRDGLLDDEVWLGNALVVDDEGSVIVGTPRGVSVYRPELDTPRPVPPPVKIREASYDETATGANRLEVRYAALTFVDEQAVRYRTRLLGIDERWSEPTAETTFRYTNLPAILAPRTYRFEVIASGPEEAWSTIPASWEVRVTPAWWTRWWAVLAGLLALTSGLVAADRLRTRRLLERTRQLATMVDERTVRIRRNVDEMRTLDRIVEVVNREVELDRVMEALLHQGLVLLPHARRGAFLLRDPETGRFRVTAVSGWERDLPPGDTVSEDEARRAFTSDAVEASDGVYAVQRVADRSGTTVLDHLESSETLLTLHLRRDRALEGYLVFELDPRSPAPSGEDADLVRRYRQHAVTALDKAHIMRRLAAASEEAAAASNAKSRFLATMSHELRTPLNSIIGFSEILVDRSDGSDPRRDRFLRNILTSGKHLLSLINDILDLSKIEAGRMQLDLEPVDVRELVHGVVGVMAGIAGRRSIAIDVDVEAGMPPLRLDAPKIRRALSNLLSNAVKFSDDGSRVAVTARHVSSRPRTHQPDVLELSVTDSGLGIPEDDRERIFEEFYQIDSGPARRWVGTGLGLALVRRYAELHGGHVDVESEPGQGSTFRIVLPAKPVPDRD
jgi:signal transduction histidine kinase/ligand-binding sensor domain-containing protein